MLGALTSVKFSFLILKMGITEVPASENCENWIIYVSCSVQNLIGLVTGPCTRTSTNSWCYYCFQHQGKKSFTTHPVSIVHRINFIFLNITSKANFILCEQLNFLWPFFLPPDLQPKWTSQSFHTPIFCASESLPLGHSSRSCLNAPCLGSHSQLSHDAPCPSLLCTTEVYLSQL